MAEPRFLCSGRPNPGASRQGMRDSAWGVREPAPTVWRLLGANNRELGRAAQFFSDELACRHSVSILRRRLPELEAAMWCDAAGRWVWRLEDQKRPIAIAPRAYLRQREALYNLEQFRAAVPIARALGCASPPAPTLEAAG
jgi:hypothetical protein